MLPFGRFGWRGIIEFSENLVNQLKKLLSLLFGQYRYGCASEGVCRDSLRMS